MPSTSGSALMASNEEPWELNRRIRAVQAELDDIDRLDEGGRLSALREAVQERWQYLMDQHAAWKASHPPREQGR
jgi:hypothetical protein